MEINKKFLIGLVIAGSIILTSNVIHAEGLEEELIKYLNDDSIDLLGRKFEEILFQNTKEAHIPMKLSDDELKAKLKFMLEDIKTLPLQAKCLWKIINQKPNALIYGLVSGNSYLKLTLGEKAYKNLIFRLFRLLLGRF